MVLSGHQPNYWPYPGLIGKIMKSDKFVYVTNVQFEKKSWQVRNRVRTKDGWNYIRVPVITKGKYYQKINEVEIDNSSNWREKELKTIHLLYGKSPYYKEYSDFIERLYTKEWVKLEDIDIYIMNYLLDILECNTEIIYDRDYDFKGSKTEMLVDMCRKLGCDTYLSNIGSSAYVEIDTFIKYGYNHRYINYKGFNYKQQYYNFEDGLSILDMLMNCGTRKTREIVMDDSNYEYSDLNKIINIE